jgi:predicted DNA-binding protein (UPF0251 family)
MGERSILTNLRLPPSLDDRAREAAARLGVPRNTFIKVVLAAALASEEIAHAPLTPEQQAVVERAVELVRGQSGPKEARQ